MKKVYICSPCRGDYENNIQRAKEYSRAAVEKGVIPVTPHIYLTQFMDDNVPEERELALKIGSELVLGCSELWAFGRAWTPLLCARRPTSSLPSRPPRPSSLMTVPTTRSPLRSAPPTPSDGLQLQGDGRG